MSVSSDSTEEFREIQGYEGYYMISNYGRVISNSRYVKHPRNGYSFKKGKEKSINKTRNGYLMVVLYKNSKREQMLIHRAVAKAFPEICGEMFDGCEIDHINTIRSDNRACNLKVCTRHENHLNPITLKKYKEKCGRFKKGDIPWNKGKKLLEKSGKNSPVSKSIIQLDKRGNVVGKYFSIAEAANTTNILRTSINNCLKGRTKTSGGYVWIYERKEGLE